MSTVQLTDDNFDEITADNDVVIDFWADWCAPCHAFAPVFDDTSERYPDVVFGKVDVESNPRLAERFSIRSIPTLVAMRDGTTLVERPGALPAPTLHDLVRELFVDGERRPDPSTQSA